MRNVIVLHGWGGIPQSFWFPYLKKELEHEKCSFCIPQLPNTDNPKLAEQSEFVLKNTKLHLPID
ncbi:MAG TPA: hypothetical protein VMR41_02725 [Patescibacteria group bacterium]|nr:hypothetical protein [Patescibacteria group bacterium]